MIQRHEAPTEEELDDEEEEVDAARAGDTAVAALERIEAQRTALAERQADLEGERRIADQQPPFLGDTLAGVDSGAQPRPSVSSSRRS